MRILIALIIIFILVVDCYAQRNTYLEHALHKVESEYKVYDWKIMKSLYGLGRDDYISALTAMNKSHEYYRHMISTSFYMWGVNGYADNETSIFKEGHWIYPYLVEQIHDDRIGYNMIYPPGADAFGGEGDMGSTRGNFARQYAAVVWKLYVDLVLPKSDGDTPHIYYIPASKIQWEKDRLLEFYCHKFPGSKYCQTEWQSERTHNSVTLTTTLEKLKPRIVLTGTKLTYNGKALPFGGTRYEWAQVIGEQPRDPEQDGEYYVFDNIGVFLKMRSSDKTKVKMIDFSLNRAPTSPFGKERPGEGFHPLKLFQGYLEVDGVQIRQDATVREINKSLSRTGSLYNLNCIKGIGICLGSVMKNEVRITVGIDTDNREDGGMLYNISFSDGMD
jgi:hypothetical protein